MFCWNCAGELPLLPASCCYCGAPHWDNLIPGASAIIEHQNRVLLIRRSAPPWIGRWDIPGGFSEPFEHPARTAIREVFEETGLPIRIGSLLGMWVGTYVTEKTAPPRATLNIYYLAFLTQSASPLLDTSETSDAQWYDISKIPTLLAFPANTRRALRAWVRSKGDQSQRFHIGT